MLAHKVQEVVAPHKGDLTGMQGFGSDFVRTARHGRHESEDFAGLRNSEDQRFSAAGADRELHLPFAEYKDATRSLIFAKQNGACRVRGRGPCLIEVGQGRRAELAKEALPPHFAGLAVFREFETVGTAHFRLLFVRFSRTLALRLPRNILSEASLPKSKRWSFDRSRAKGLFLWHRRSRPREDRDTALLRQAMVQQIDKFARIPRPRVRRSSPQA